MNEELTAAQKDERAKLLDIVPALVYLIEHDMERFHKHLKTMSLPSLYELRNRLEHNEEAAHQG